MEWNGDIDWFVQAVYDPDGGGGDLAYTVGLVRHGVPELHVWSRPPEGDDVGTDWALSPHDSAHLLNGVAARLLRGEVAVGSTWTATYDGGFTTVTYRIDHPVAASEVEALALDADAPVLPLRWSLRRPVEPPSPVPYASSWQQDAEQRRDHIIRATAARAAAWGCSPIALPQPSGDAVGDLLATIRAVVCADGSLAWPLLGAVAVADHSRSVLATTAAAARALGRRAIVERYLEAAHADAQVLADHMLANVTDPAADEPWVDAARAQLTLVLGAAYSALVVADALEPAALDAGTGWLFAVLDPGRAHRLFAACGNTAGRSAADVPARPTADRGSVAMPIDGDELYMAVLRSAAVAACSGHGAPLLDDDETAWHRLERRGFVA